MKVLRALLYLTMFSSLFFSCADEDMPKSQIETNESPAVISMNLSIQDRTSVEVESRALSQKVYDFYLFVFDSNQRLISKYYFPNNATVPSADYSTDTDASITRETESTGIINNIKAMTGTNYIMGVANVNTKLQASILTTLNGVSTVSALKNILAKEPTIAPESFTMSGFYSENQNTLSEDGAVQVLSTTESLSGWVHLVPVDAEINFEVATHEESGGEFILESWQVVNVPEEAYLFHNGNEPATDFYTPDAKVDFKKNGTSFGFNFYMQERCTTASAEVPSYGDRAKWNGTADGKKNYVYAPANATYVILKGNFKGKSAIANKDQNQTVSDDVDVNADVTYYVFLGHNSTNDTKDFTTKRNVSYTYKVTVKGVKDISVEVRHNDENGNDIENRADAEGSIVIASGEELALDAHYEARVLKFTKQQIQTAVTEGRMGYATITPYGNAIYVDGVDANDTEQAPLASWVKFYNGVNEVGTGRYPATFTTNVKNNLMTVKQLLDALEGGLATDGFYDANDEVYITAYIDEYYYDVEPGTTQAASWKDFVNADDRMLMILANTELSTDAHSSITTATYVFRQKSILTIYDKNASGLSRAWGLEVVEEDLTAQDVKTLRKGSGITDGSEAKWGRKNSSTLQGKSWNVISNTGYLNQSTVEGNMIYACMQRNRDLDGNGTISADEVRWYVPSLYQYQQMYIGMYGIEDRDARLYYTEAVDDEQWFYKHYISSYDQQILWAEEGLSDGAMGASFSDKYYMRCVRDLGVDISSETFNGVSWNASNQFQDFYTTDGNTIELTYLNRNSVNTSLETVEITGDCTTFSENNKPSIRYEYRTQLVDGYFKTENGKAEKGENTVCSQLGDGWRIPTLTEMNLLMQAFGAGNMYQGANSEKLLTRTKFEFHDRNHIKVSEYNQYPQEPAYIPYNGTDGKSRITSTVYKSSGNRWVSDYQIYSGRYAHCYNGSDFHLSNGDYGKYNSSGNAWDSGNVDGKIRCVRNVK